MSPVNENPENPVVVTSFSPPPLLTATRKLGATSYHKPLAPGPGDVLCPKVIDCLVLFGAKALRSKNDLGLECRAACCEGLPYLKTALSDSFQLAAELAKEL